MHLVSFCPVRPGLPPQRPHFHGCFQVCHCFLHAAFLPQAPSPSHCSAPAACWPFPGFFIRSFKTNHRALNNVVPVHKQQYYAQELRLLPCQGRAAFAHRGSSVSGWVALALLEKAAFPCHTGLHPANWSCHRRNQSNVFLILFIMT